MKTIKYPTTGLVAGVTEYTQGGKTWVCTKVGPPAQWEGKSNVIPSGGGGSSIPSDQELVYAPSLEWNTSLGKIGYLTLTGNAILNTPINGRGEYTLFLFQDSVGGRTLSFGTGMSYVDGAIIKSPNSLTILTIISTGDKAIVTLDKTGLLLDGITEPTNPPVGPNSPNKLPAKVLGCYFETYNFSANPSTGVVNKLTDIPLIFNLLYIFRMRPMGTTVAEKNAAGNYNNLGNGTFTLGADWGQSYTTHINSGMIQECRNRGQLCIMTVGGSGSGYNFNFDNGTGLTPRQKANNFIASVKSAYSITGGFDGIDFNQFEANVVSTAPDIAANIIELTYIVQQLRLEYGDDFIVSAPPAPGRANDKQLLKGLLDNGVLSFAAPQFYDNSVFKSVDNISGFIDDWVTLFNGDASKVVVGLSANYSFSNSPTLAECVREWNKLAAAHPTIRGAFCWNAQTNLNDSNNWGSTMAALVYKNSNTTTTPPNSSQLPVFGVNLSGMEWANPGLRVNTSTSPTRHYTVPRDANMPYLKEMGLTKTRLPIQWELLQPVLFDSTINSATQAIVGVPGAFNAQYKGYIVKVLDAHAANGMKCIVDLHNYCRYKDFLVQPDGSITGLNAGSTFVRPYTTSANTINRIMSKAATPSLTKAQFNDFWVKFATEFKDHPGLGGYGLMNEPNSMPAPGSAVAGTSSTQDLSIWAEYAQGAINAIRAVDAVTPIYVSGNNYSQPTSYAVANPSYPLQGTNLIYEMHFYLDATSSGGKFDYDTEVALGYAVNETGALTPTAGQKRLQSAITWAEANGNQKIAVGEVGMPRGDARWITMMRYVVDLAVQKKVELFLWNTGDHWPLVNNPLYAGSQWYQDKRVASSVQGELHRGLGIEKWALFDVTGDFPGTGVPQVITVFRRGYSAVAQTITLTLAGTGSLSASSITIPAGANQSAVYTYTPGANAVASVTYGGASQVPPVRKLYSMNDPVAYESISLADAAKFILNKYSASMWKASDAYGEYLVEGQVATTGNTIRAIADSGYGSRFDNVMEMRCFIDATASQNTLSLPKLATDTINTVAVKAINCNSANLWGLWCRKRAKVAPAETNSKETALFNLNDNHFVIACASNATTSASGVIASSGASFGTAMSQIRVDNGYPAIAYATTTDTATKVTSATAIAANTPFVISLVSNATSQVLRVNSEEKGTGTLSLPALNFTDHYIGWSYTDYFERGGNYPGNIYNVIMGKGNPTSLEMGILERYAASLANVTLAAPGTVTPPPPAETVPKADTAPVTQGYAYSGGQVGAWHDLEPEFMFDTLTGTGAVSVDDALVGSFKDRSRTSVFAKALDSANRGRLKLFGSQSHLDVFTGYSSTVGGSANTPSNGFFFAQAVTLGAYYSCLFDDRSSANANNGRYIRYSGDDGGITFSVGTGSTRVSVKVTGVAALYVNPTGVRVTVRAWQDGTTINLQVNDGAVISTSCAACSPGTAGYTLGGKNGATGSVESGVKIASSIHYNNPLTSTLRDSIYEYVKTKAIV